MSKPLHSPPIEVAMKMSSMIHTYVSPLLESTSPSSSSKNTYMKNMSFVVDVMQMISTVLNEIVFMKLKLSSSTSSELFHQMVLMTTIVQITFQLELLRLVHVAHMSAAACDDVAASSSSSNKGGNIASGNGKKGKKVEKERKREKTLNKIIRIVDSSIFIQWGSNQNRYSS